MRETKELRIAMAPAITGTRFAVKQEYSKALLNLIIYNLQHDGKVSLLLRIMLILKGWC